MCTIYRKEVSVNGYPLKVLKSALQKYIRRGNVEKALYFAGELYGFKNMEGGTRVYTNFVNRLLVICLEDVCNLQLVLDEVPAILSIYKKDSLDLDEKRILSTFITKMCVSVKARACSHARSVYTDVYTDYSLPSEHPSIAQEETVESALAVFAETVHAGSPDSIAHAFQISQRKEKLAQSFRRRRKAVYGIFRVIEAKWPDAHVFYSLFTLIGHLKEGFMCWCAPLLHILGYVPIGENPAVECPVYTFSNSTLLEVDDFVYDMHTGHRGTPITFAMEGARVFPEASWVNKEHKFEYYKKKGCTLETDLFTFRVRTQLVCSAHKQDTYLATLANGEDVFVKGPFDSIDTFERIQRAKQNIGMHTIPYTSVLCLPNRWVDGTPLGYRNKCDRFREYIFVYTPCLIDLDGVYTITKTSKRWPETRVVDWSRYALHANMFTLPPREMKELVECILFRYASGIPDFAARNFLSHAGRVYSIDEDIAGRAVNLFTELGRKRSVYVRDWVEREYDTLAEWFRAKWGKAELVRLFQRNPDKTL